MALQDLTPQLRTRLSRMERAVGWFVILATALLLFGFAYYIYNTAQRKGWFITKVNYQTSISSAAGLQVGDPVKLMGFDVGEITGIEANAPGDSYNVTVYFEIRKPYYGYLWTDSKVRVAAGGFLGDRYLEVMKGYAGVPTVYQTANEEAAGVLDRQYYQQKKQEFAQLETIEDESDLFAALNADAREHPSLYYTNLTTKPYWLDPEESLAVTERLEQVMDQVEAALPGILNLTNQLAVVLSNSAVLTANLNDVASSARPAVSNLALVTANLNQPGALGNWLLPTNINTKLDSVLANADTTLVAVNTNLTAVSHNLNESLENLALITSNLNAQVQANTNILGQISTTVVNTDELIQGLKRHWLLRSAFKEEGQSEKPRSTPTRPLRSPRDAAAP